MQILHGSNVVADKNQCAAFLKSADESHAFLREHRVAYRQRFVDNQDVGVDVRDHSKGKSHVHAAGIRLNRLLHELPNVRKFGDRVKSLVDFFVAQPQH